MTSLLPSKSLGSPLEDACILQSLDSPTVVRQTSDEEEVVLTHGVGHVVGTEEAVVGTLGALDGTYLLRDVTKKLRQCSTALTLNKVEETGLPTSVLDF